METVTKRLYEGMFLIDSAQAAADWEGTLSMISTILERADAEVVAMRKWQERKLAFDIDHKTRGTYILCYFKADSQRIAGIEKDVLLSENVMRVLVLGTDKRPASMLKRDISGEPEVKAEAPKAPTPTPAAEAPKAPAPTPAAEGPATETPAEATPAQTETTPEEATAPVEPVPVPEETAPAETAAAPEEAGQAEAEQVAEVEAPQEEKAPEPEAADAPAEEGDAEDAEKVAE